MRSVASGRAMTEAGLLFGLRLSLQAGWNQTEADWRRCLDLQPDGGFVAEWDGTPAGTTTICIFGDVAWVAMLLVDERLRGRGIGMALIRQALPLAAEHPIPSLRPHSHPPRQPFYQ